MPNDVAALLKAAAEPIRQEADKLRAKIDQLESKHRATVDPLREQLQELEAAIARIEGRPEPSGDGGGRRAPRGANQRAILNYVEKNPGATGTSIAEGTGITRTTVYATLAKL